jgi:hypothetical protein
MEEQTTMDDDFLSLNEGGSSDIPSNKLDYEEVSNQYDRGAAFKDDQWVNADVV